MVEVVVVVAVAVAATAVVLQQLYGALMQQVVLSRAIDVAGWDFEL